MKNMGDYHDHYLKKNVLLLVDVFEKNPPTFISYPDMNNLYGWAMSKYLPYKGFKWLKILINLI